MYEVSARIDWVAGTAKTPFAWELLFGDYQTRDANGRWGYDRAAMTQDGVIILRSSTRIDMGTHIIAGASALDAMVIRRNKSSLSFLKNLVAVGARITRLDLCIDVMIDYFDITRLVAAYEKGDITTKARGGSVIRNIQDRGHTLYVGRRGSRKLLRVYDKGAQLGISANWVRIELELRRDAAQTATEIVSEAENWEYAVPKLIKGFVDFPTCTQWQRVIGAETIVIKAPALEESKTRKWLIEVCAKSMGQLYTEGDKDIIRDVLQAASNVIKQRGKQTSNLTIDGGNDTL